jgi:hypothetical protein
MCIKILRSINPWWERRDWERADKHLRKFRESKYQYIPPWLFELSLRPFSLNFVVGPRLVGKTTGLKLLVKKLIGEGYDPRRLVYVDCEVFPDFTALRECITELLKRLGRDIVILLDEISSLERWWRGVKFLIDSGALEESVVIATGSSSLKVRKDAELFPGRLGHGVHVEALPLGFPEYLELHGARSRAEPGGGVAELFEKYLRTGGFLSVINGEPPSEILKGVVGELVRLGKSLEVTKEVLASLIAKIPSALSFRAIASDTSGYSYKVVQDYLETLRELYVVGFGYLRRGRRVEYRKEKKIFFRDPLFLRLFSEWCGVDFLDSALFECVVQEHVLRARSEVYYYRDGYEIDVVADGLKVEVKAGKPHRRYPRGVTVLDREDIPEFLVGLSGGSENPALAGT